MNHIDCGDILKILEVNNHGHFKHTRKLLQVLQEFLHMKNNTYSNLHHYMKENVKMVMLITLDDILVDMKTQVSLVISSLMLQEMLTSMHRRLKTRVKVFILKMETLNIKESMVIRITGKNQEEKNIKKYYALTAEHNIDHDHI